MTKKTRGDLQKMHAKMIGRPAEEEIRPVRPDVPVVKPLVVPGGPTTKDFMTKLEEEKNRLEAQIASMTGIVEELARARELEQKVGSMMGAAYGQEIAEGKHNGMGLTDIIMMYMRRERQVAQIAREMRMSWDRAIDELEKVKENRKERGL